MVAVQELIDNKVFLGHPKNTSNPKTRDSWLGTHNGMVIFDPETVAKQIEAASKMFADAKKSNKEILVICEKEVYKQEVEKLAEEKGFHYLNHKIPAGVLTNFDTLLSRIRSLKDMRGFVGSESFDLLTKKEQGMKKRSLAKIEQVYKWVVNLRKKPDLVIIVDGQMMHKFVEEVVKLKLDSIVLSSSNFDMRTQCQMILCNVNSQQSIGYVMKTIAG